MKTGISSEHVVTSAEHASDRYCLSESDGMQYPNKILESHAS